LVGIVDVTHQGLDLNQVAALPGGELDVRWRVADGEPGLLRGPPVQPDASELETAVQVTELRRSEPRSFALLSLDIRSDARDLEPVGKDLEPHPKSRRLRIGRDLRQAPGLSHVAFGLLKVGVTEAVVVVETKRGGRAARIELDMSPRVRAEHQEAREVRRIDRGELHGGRAHTL